LNEGSSLAKALEPHGHIFPPLYVNMVAAGEASGTLETVLERLADFMEKQAHLRGKVGGALAYPILMMIMGTALMTVMMIVVVPKVTNIYSTLDRALPGTRRSSSSCRARSRRIRWSAPLPLF
jgi:general secretion pathway protein F